MSGQASALVKKSDGAGTVMIVGSHFEHITTTNDVETQCTASLHTFGGQRVAMRTGGAVYWLHGDHLGSASLTTSITGTKVSELRYLPFGETRWAWGVTPTDRRYTGQRELAGVGLYDYNARMYWPAAWPERSRRAGRFVSADTVVPDPHNPQQFNRYAYVVNNPLRHTDPTGHCLDDYCGMPGGPGSPAKVAGNRGSQYACVRGYGCFDTKHLRNFPNPGGQRGLWDRFQREAGMSRQFALPIESSLGGGSALKITYRVAGGLPQGQWAAVAMGIFLDYAREYESAQFIRSGFANQDMPSNYVGMLAAINGISPDAILMKLAGAAGQPLEYQDAEEPQSRAFPQNEPHRNYGVTPRVYAGGGWRNTNYPPAVQALAVAPSNNRSQWTRASAELSYFYGAFQYAETYDASGQVSSTWSNIDGSLFGLP